MIEVERLIVRLIGDSSSFSRMVKEAGVAMSRLGSQIRRIGQSFSLYITAPLVIAGRAIWKLGSDFETNMQKIVGLVGMTQEEVNKLGKQVLELAPKVGKSAVELSDALYYITSSGLRDMSKAMDVLTVASKASAAGLGNTQTIADAVTSAMNAYEKTGLTAARATDVLTASVREGKLEATAISKVMGRAIPMAANLGVSFEDVAGQLALVSRTGETGSRAVTSLAQLLMNLVKPSQEAEDALTGVGLTFEQLREVAKQPMGLINVVRIIDKAFGGKDTALAQIIPDMRSLRGAMTVLALNTETVNKVMEGTRNAAGSLDTAFKAISKTARQQMNVAFAQLGVTMVEISKVLNPMIASAAKRVANVLIILTKAWKELSIGSKKALIIFTMIAAAIGPVLIVLGLLAGSLGAIVSLFGMLLSPVVLITAAVATLGVQLIGVGNIVEWFGKQWAALINYLKPALDAIKDALAAEDLALAVQISWEQIKLAWFEGTQDLRSNWLETMAGMEIIFLETAAAIQTEWNKLITNLSLTTETIRQGYRAAISEAAILYTEAEGLAKQAALSPELPGYSGYIDEIEKQTKLKVEALRNYRQSQLPAEQDILDAIVKNADKAKGQVNKDLDMAIEGILRETEHEKGKTQTEIDRLTGNRDALVEWARIEREMTRGFGIPGEKGPEFPGDFKAPPVPDIGGAKGLGTGEVKYLGGSRVGTVEHEQRLADYRATLGAKNPEVQELNKIATILEEIAKNTKVSETTATFKIRGEESSLGPLNLGMGKAGG